MNGFSISTHPIETGRLQESLADPASGGYASFEGRVRDHNDGRRVRRLEYEAYEPLALREGGRIIAEAVARFGVTSAACMHRVGELGIGETAVWVGVRAGHRGEAFEACRYIIDAVKHRLPIWKKEHYADGDSGWVNCAHPAVDHRPFEHDYSRQVVLAGVGADGRARLKRAAVLVVGAGGLGVPVLQYLTAAGVGRIGVVDGDPLEIELETLDEALNSGFELVDIREPWELAMDPAGLELPIRLALSDLVSGREEFPAQGRFLVVCAHGVRSLALTEHLRSLGQRDVFSLRGGLAELRI